MKTVLICLLWLAATVSTAAAPATSAPGLSTAVGNGKDVVSKDVADSLYEKEHYAEAARIYEQLLHLGPSFTLYYNLGNCYYKLDDIPYAIVNYERAALLNPADADTRANLALARSKTIDKVTPPSELFFVTWWKNLSNLASIPTWAAVAVASFVLLLIAFLLYVFADSPRLRKVSARIAVLMLLLTVFTNLFILTQHHVLSRRSGAVVIAPAVTVRSTPSDSGTDLFVIHAGSKVEILDKTMRQWREVRIEEGKQGWVPADVLEVI